MDLEMQLRAAEARRAELERQHVEALQILRGCGPETLEVRQSRVRELEKKVALETVRCEELQLELAASQRSRMGTGVPINPMAGTTDSQSWSNKGTEIERIMAKIEQDNRILAELDHSRSTTLGTSNLSASFLPANPGSMGVAVYNPTNTHYSATLGHHQYGTMNKANLMGTTMNSLTHHQAGMTSNMGTTGILGTSHAPNITIGTGVMGTLSSTIGSSIIPSSYTQTAMSNSHANQLTNNPTGLHQTSFNNPSFGNQVTSALTQYSLPYNNPINPSVTTSYTNNNVTFSNAFSSQYNNLPLTGTVSNKLKQIDDVDLGNRRVATPVTPHPPPWGGTNMTGITDLRPRLLNDGIDCDWSGIHGDRSFLNGQNALNTEGQVDMLDIPGKGRCSVYIARFSYEPEPDADEELSIQAGDYLLVWGEPIGPGGYLDAELLDGRRGLVPSHFVQRLLGDDLLEFHQAVLSTLREEEINQENFAADVAKLNELAELSEAHEDDGPEGDTADLLFSVLVPAPRQLTLERQLNKSVLISWIAPDGIGPGNHIESYHVYVDGVLKTTIKATERTRALVEGVDSNRPHRISVRSVTANRRTSRDAACTMIIGRDTHSLGPSAVRASNITSTSAVISWLPANSNHQHIVCVNNVEVRTVKPGVYRHTITGLAPNTQYRVTVRAKHHRAAQNVANLAEDLPMPAAAHTDFRTLPKGLPDPPSEIMVEPGPQDGTLLVTWHPIQISHHPSSSITGYAVYADGKKVTDVDSPTGDHALIDISKLLGLNPKNVTVRTKARDSQSTDSVPTPIPVTVLRGGAMKSRQQPHSAVMPPHIRQQMPRQQQQMQGQQIIEPDENLSDKEIFPNSTNHRTQGGIPAIAISSQPNQRNVQQQLRNQQVVRSNSQQNNPPNPQKRARWFVALFDYDPATMSPNPDACDEELPFSEGDTIKIWGDKDADGFYWGECRGRRGYVPHNMVMEVEGNQNRDRWGDIYANMPVKRMVALYDYDPQELSPNVDAEQVELSFTTGQIINVYGEMDDDGFYMGEIDGVRGLVPSNFLTEAPEQYSAGQTSQQGGVQVRGGQRGRGTGPVARGPLPPTRDNQLRSRNKENTRGRDSWQELTLEGTTEYGRERCESPKPRSSARRSWSVSKHNSKQNHFWRKYKKNVTPSLTECVVAIDTNEELSQRSATQLKSFIQYQINKKGTTTRKTNNKWCFLFFFR